MYEKERENGRETELGKIRQKESDKAKTQIYSDYSDTVIERDRER